MDVVARISAWAQLAHPPPDGPSSSQSGERKAGRLGVAVPDEGEFDALHHRRPTLMKLASDERRRWSTRRRKCGLTDLLWTRRRAALLAPLGLLTACEAQRSDALGPVPGSGPRPGEAAKPSATIDIHTIEASYIGTVAWGGGTLTSQGRSYPFRVLGLGVGGIGVSRGSAAGDVYGLASLADFPGLYGQLRIGAVLVDREVLGNFWLENKAGVRMHLHPREEGLALRVGADGLLIEFT